MNTEPIKFNERVIMLAGENKNELARVVSQSREIYHVRTADAEKLAKVSGKFSYNANTLLDYPVVGDYVLLNDVAQSEGIINTVLPRTSLFMRVAAGTSGAVQAIAANIDTCLIAMSLNQDFNIRRLERYLTLAWDSGAVPVVILTKADLCDDIDTKKEEVESVALGVDIIVASAQNNEGYAALNVFLAPHKTVAFLGSSGVGKSTLINKLMGVDAIKTNMIREDDDKGRHTTTTRNLFYLKNGAAVIDTPGMREVGVESGEVAHSFADIENLADQCKFSDCKHSAEPGCAVKAAIEKGEVTRARLESYKKLKIEMGYDGLTARQREVSKLDRMMADFGGLKSYKKQQNKSKSKK